MVYKPASRGAGILERKMPNSYIFLPHPLPYHHPKRLYHYKGKPRMKTENEHIDNLIRHFVQGDITADELGELNDFIRQSEENRQYARNLRELLFDRAATKAHEEFDVEQALHRFRAHVHTGNTGEKQAQRLPIKLLVRVAAVILIAVLPIIAYFLGMQKVNRQFAMIETNAPDGSQLSLVLPDGSKVKLNSGSTIRYSQGFGISDRKIYLHGEGFFCVKHNERLPLSIVTKDVVLHDLGTAFKVSNYQVDQQVEISLYEGELSIDNLISQQKSLAVKPGERIVVNKTTGQLHKESIKETMDEGASMNTLYFDNQPLEMIAPVLSRNFGVPIAVDKEVRNRRFYLIFNKKTTNIEQILQTITQTGHVKCRWADGHYCLY
jgi:hypothetical protein